jgi:hypothetical protein
MGKIQSSFTLIRQMTSEQNNLKKKSEYELCQILSFSKGYGFQPKAHHVDYYFLLPST